MIRELLLLFVVGFLLQVVAVVLVAGCGVEALKRAVTKPQEKQKTEENLLESERW